MKNILDWSPLRRGVVVRSVVVTAVSLMVVIGVESRRATAAGKLVDLHVGALAGGMTGRGSDSGTPDMFHQTEGAAFGAEVGVRLLVMDFSLRFQQMVNSKGTGGTIISAMLGPALEIPIMGGVLLRPSLAGGVVLGTLVPVDPPLNNDQLAGKGLLTTARFGVERMFGPVVGVGAQVEGGYHYLLGASGVANGKDHSAGWQMGGFATLTFHLGI